MQEINNGTFLKLVFMDRGSFESLNCSESYHLVNTAINSNTQSEAFKNVTQNWLTNDLCIPNLVYISQYWVKVLTCYTLDIHSLKSMYKAYMSVCSMISLNYFGWHELGLCRNSQFSMNKYKAMSARNVTHNLVYVPRSNTHHLPSVSL